MFNPQKLYKNGQTNIDKTRTICQNDRNLAKRAEIPVSIVGRKILDHLLCNHRCKKAQQRVQFCADRRNLEQPSAISKSVRFCFSQREMAQPSQPTLKRAPFFETRANLPNEQRLSKCAHFQTHGNLCSFDGLGIQYIQGCCAFWRYSCSIKKTTRVAHLHGTVARFWWPCPKRRTCRSRSASVPRPSAPRLRSGARGPSQCALGIPSTVGRSVQ